MPQIKP